MGRFLGGSPRASDGARRGRQYAALPAQNEEDDDGRQGHSEEGSAAAAAAAAVTSSVESSRQNSRSALMESDSELEDEDDGASDVQQAEERVTARGGSSGAAEAGAEFNNVAAAPEVEQKEAVAERESPEQSSESDGEQAAAGGEEGEPLEDGFIHIRILDLNGKFFNIACRLDWTVTLVKKKVLEATEVAVTQQRLIYRGRVLEDESCLADYKVEDGHTIHLFVRAAPTPDPEILSAELNANGSATTGARTDDGPGMTIVHINGETVSSAVFPSDSARRVDPLMLDSALGNCARRVKLWSSFLLIIYTMKVMGQFALLANDQQMRSQQNADGGTGDDSNNRPMDRYDDYPQYYNPDPLMGGVELLIHGFGVYVGCVGFKAAHDTDIRPIRFYFRGLIWLAILTLIEQVYITVQISNSDFPAEHMRYPYGQGPTKDDIVSANVFQIVMLAIMWVIAVRHSYQHVREVVIYNQSFAAAAMNAVPPAQLAEVV